MRTILFVVCSGLALTAAPASSPDVTLAVADRANSAPWVAASGSFVAVAWGASSGGKADVMLAVSRDGGQSFGAPVRVNATAGDARIGGEIPPRVSVSAPRGRATPLVTVTWNARDGSTEVRSARSTDGGLTFSAAVRLQKAGAAGDRGWQAATLDANGDVHAVWLDHRGLAADKAAGGASGHKGEHDGVAMAQKSSLFYASTAVPGERELFKGVCYCCKTALVAGPAGEIYAAWRHVFDGNMRDIAFTSSRDGGRTFSPLVRVNEDKWSINGCPDDGPAMVADAAGTVHLVWPTVLDGAQGAIHYASSTDGRTFTPPVRVPTRGTPKPSHPQIAVDARGRLVVAWDEVVNGVRSAAARAITRGEGRVEFGPITTIAEGASTYPVLAATGAGWVAVWATGGETSVVHARRFSSF